MAKIIQFPSKPIPQDEVMRYVAHRIIQHLIVVMYERNILDIPVQAFVKDMCTLLVQDGFDLDMETAEIMLSNPETLKRIERVFLRTLVERGYIDASKA